MRKVPPAGNSKQEGIMAKPQDDHVPDDEFQPDPLLREKPLPSYWRWALAAVILLMVGLVFVALTRPTNQGVENAAITGPSAPPYPPAAANSRVDQLSGAGSRTPGQPPVAGDAATGTVTAPAPRPPLPPPPASAGQQQQTTGQGAPAGQ
jgi:hypothetical protein